MTFAKRIIIALVLLVTAFAVLQPNSALANGNGNGNANGNPHANPKGKYTVRFRGAYRGTLKVIVTGGHLKFTGTLKDADGNASSVNASVARDGGHFGGTLTLANGDVTVSGRVDNNWVDDDGEVRAARIVGLLRDGNGQFSRLAGAKGDDDTEGEPD